MTQRRRRWDLPVTCVGGCKEDCGYAEGVNGSTGHCAVTKKNEILKGIEDELENVKASWLELNKRGNETVQEIF